MATISTHNGSAVRREHNIRNENVIAKQGHIDPNGEHEIWHDEPIRKAYHRLFDADVVAYNNKQTREDRKIDNYYNHVSKDAKKHTSYEMIIGVYGQEVAKEQSYAILKEFFEGWKDRNPNLELIGAYYHADEEGQPHVHIDYIPVAHGYKKGMETQTALVKALGEMGFIKEGSQTAQIQWEASENQALEDICIQYGLEIEHPERDKGKHLLTDIYKAEQELSKLKDQIFISSEDVASISPNKGFLSGKVRIDSLEFQKLQNTAILIDKVKGNYSDSIECAERANAYLKSAKDKADSIVLSARNKAQDIIHEAEEQASYMPLTQELEFQGRIAELQNENRKLTKELNAFKKFIKENGLKEQFRKWVKDATFKLSRDSER